MVSSLKYSIPIFQKSEILVSSLFFRSVDLSLKYLNDENNHHKIDKSMIW